MKIAIVAILGIFFVMLVSGCIRQHTCDPPYTVRGSGCCLDQNGNKICDADEPGTENQTAKNYGSYEIKMYITQTSPEPDSWGSLPHTPAKHYDNYQVYNYQQDGSYYEGGWLILYSNYLEEPITCTLGEYHDTVLLNQQNVRLTEKGFNSTVNGVAIRALYMKQSVITYPTYVRYTIDCAGDESGITFQDAYVVGLRPP